MQNSTLKKFFISYNGLNTFLVLMAFLLISAFTSAQEITVTGVVNDAKDRSSLPGVSVIVKGTTIGTLTDFDGKFSIKVNSTGVLVFSFIGYEPTEVPVEGKTQLTVSMFETVYDVEEVIVIGYGMQKKTDKTGAVAQIKASEMNGGVMTDVIQAVQGRTAGVMITKKGGDPNSGFTVKIRGASGFDAGTQPLYVVDGVPGVDPTTIAPEDIETFNVLKDASSSAIYGSRGSNGVIIISTKRGGMGKELSQIEFSTKISIDRVAKKLDLLSADEYRNFCAENNIAFQDGGANTDWQDKVFRTGMTHSYNLNFAGGTEKGSYYVSLTQADWTGVMRGTEKARTIGKINLTHKSFDGKLVFTGTMSGTFENNNYQNYDGFDRDDIINLAYSRNPTDPVYNADGTYNKETRGVFNNENPMLTINNVTNNRDAKRFFGSLKTDLEIIKGLIASVNIGYTRDDNENSYFRPSGLYSSADNGFARRGYENNATKLFEGTVNYVKSINDVHNINFIGGYSWQNKMWDSFFVQARNAFSDQIGADNLAIMEDFGEFGDKGSGRGEWTLIGFFGRAQYNYLSKYFLTASIRRDGSSKFGANNKWGTFPTVALGWDMQKESFMENFNAVDLFKVRLSYGVSGNQEIGEYRSLLAMRPTSFGTNPESGERVIVFTPAWNANPDLKWEETKEVNFGIDFAFLNNRVSGSFEMYYKKTEDLLGQYTVPKPPNLVDRTWANSGSMQNKGIELNTQVYVLDYSWLKWKTTFNVALNRQKLLDLGEYAPPDGVRKEGYLTGRGMIGDVNYVTGVIEGQPLGSFYMPEYVGMTTDGKGEFLYRAESGGITREYTLAKRSIVGCAAPKYELGWSNSFTIYDHWTCDFSFRALIGNKVYNATKMYFDYPVEFPALNRVPEAMDWYKQGRTSNPTIMDYYVEDASFLRMDYLSFGYNFNFNTEYFKTLKLYLASNNLFVLTKYSGVDPETSVDGLSFGVDMYNVYPKTRTFTFGLTATF